MHCKLNCCGNTYLDIYFYSFFIFYVSKLILIIALKSAANCKENLFRRYPQLTYFFTYVFIYLLTYERDGETDFC